MMKKYAILTVLCLGFLVQACTETGANKKSFNTVLKGKEFVNANHKFAFDVYKNIAENEVKENYLFSPVSLSLALGMAYNGAANNTKTAFENTLHYTPFASEEINSINQEIISNLSDNSAGSLFEIANSIWIKDSFMVKDDFINLNKDFYRAEVQKLDFYDTKSVDIINNWVSDKTYEKIPKIINSISSDEVLFLINAIYFKSDWKYNFKEENTKELPFYGENETKNVKMMHLKANLNFYENENLTAVKLPYKNDKYAMTVLLPKDGTDVDAISKSLTITSWENWNSNFSEKEVQFAMPKFTFSYEKKLNNPLMDLGLGNAFSSAADFSNISNEPIEISYVLQKTFIEVNEKGTEAAAVTSIGFVNTSVDPNQNVVNLNKPFLFAITEKETNSICFIGKIGMPNLNE